MKPLRVAFCVSGRGMLYRAAVRRRTECGIEPVLLVAETKASEDLEVFSAANGVMVERAGRGERASLDELLEKLWLQAQPDLVALTFDRIIGPSLVAAYRHRIINVHPALLPAHAGMHAMRRTVESGSLVGGASIHEVTERVDAGPLIAQAVVPIVPGEPMDEYGRRMYRLLEPLFLQTLRWFAEERVVRDDRGLIRIVDAHYGGLPFVPALERFPAS